MSRIQDLSVDDDMAFLEAALRGLRLTRDDIVRMEGAQAASRGLTRRDNPYRPQSADGVSWRMGFEDEMRG
ncbi:hypothetical protein [Aureimonas sp. SK2]|uniref:hypothetical protein n=1 Tax=Aureimonas sp. SK2 TaxID=3015992 RepID=UPI002444BF1F|nr:hypothetical protein [Aureimonas sp. SK2]